MYAWRSCIHGGHGSKRTKLKTLKVMKNTNPNTQTHESTDKETKKQPTPHLTCHNKNTPYQPFLSNNLTNATWNPAHSRTKWNQLQKRHCRQNAEPGRISIWQRHQRDESYPRYQKHDKIYAIKNASVDTPLRWSTKWQGIRTDAATGLSNAAENTTNNKLNQNALRP